MSSLRFKLVAVLGLALCAIAVAFPAMASGPLVANQAQALMLASNGSKTVCSVGDNANGQLGDGTRVDRSSLVTAAILTNTLGVATGWYHSLAVLDNGTVWAWGNNSEGELGDGTTNDHDTPMPVPGLTGMTAVAAGQYHSLALKGDGTVWAWGYNSSGRLGDGTQNQRTSPVQVVGLTNVVAIAAAQQHSLALKSDGTVWTWGYNGNGELGDGTNLTRLTAVQVVGLSTVTSIGSGANHSLALKSDGTLWTWGYNGYGQLGNGNNQSQANIVRATGLVNVVGFAGGNDHSIAVKGDGTVWTWGYNVDGELGDGTTGAQKLSPVQVPTMSAATAVAAGAKFSAALRSDGSLWTWGANTDGQLGTGTSASSIIPVAALPCAPPPPPVLFFGALLGRQIAAQNQSLAIAYDNTLWGWGDNTSGQLGDGTTVSRTAPVQAAGIAGATAVASGWDHGLAVAGGSVWSWGIDSNGQLGDGGSNSNHPTPLPIAGLNGMITVAAGQYHSLALKNDGTVWAWGYNGNGRLGDGTSTQRSSPVQVIGLSGIIDVAVGQSHSLALKSDGTVWGWGDNGSAQLGIGTFTDSANAVQVKGLTGVVSIAAGANHSMALKTDGTVWTWGLGNSGQLGNGSTVTYQTEIVRASGLTDVVAIAGGVSHSLAVKSDGTVWSFGENGDGQLGDGTATRRTVPVKANNLTSAIAVAAGLHHSFAVQRDGSLWSWGTNPNGQFGAALPASSTVPVKINVAQDFGAWQPASMISPAPAAPPGTTLYGSRVTFSWNDTGAQAYWLDVGDVLGQGNIFGQNVGATSTRKVAHIPMDGRNIYVRLWTLIHGGWQSNSYVYKAATFGPAEIESPAEGSTLGPSVSFTWNPVPGATAYWLDVGTAPGQGNVFGQNVGTATSQTVNNIPTRGEPLYVKLWTLINGTWYASDPYIYTQLNAAFMTSPPPDSTLIGSSVTFTWSNAAGASAYWLDVGTVPGQGNVFGQNVGTATSRTVIVPALGQPLYVKLFSLINGNWYANSYTYTQAIIKGDLTNQFPNLMLPCTPTFTWTNVGASAYWLDIGTVEGQGNIFGQNVGTSTSRTVTNIPANGQPVYVRLFSNINGVWQANSYTFTACPGVTMVSPQPGSTLTGSSATFTWTNVGAAAYWIDVGTVAGQGNIFGQNVSTNTSRTVTGIPTTGQTIYVTLWGLINGVWQSNSYTYTSPIIIVQPSNITSPSQGSTLTGSSVTFFWNNSGATAYWLDVGTAAGQGDIFGQNVGTNTSRTVTGIPTTGQTIYVKLWSLINGAWQANSYTYTASTSVPASIFSPAPGSTLTSGTVTFFWNNAGATAYWLDVGTAAGQGNIFGQSVGTNTFQTVTGIPINHQPVYVKLWSLFNGVWQGNAYTYTAP